MKLIITDPEFLPPDLHNRLDELACEVYVHTSDEVPENPSSYTLAFGGRRFKQWGIKAFSNLQFLQLSMAGYNHLPVEAWKEKGIVLSNARDVFSDPIAEWVVFYMLMHAKQGLLHLKQQEEKVWIRQNNTELTHQSAIIYGSGSIGLAIAKRLKPFGVKCIGVNSNGRLIEGFDACVSFKESKALLAQADTVIMTLPLNHETRHAFDASYVETIKKGAIFLNVGRGHIVDEPTLIKQLKSKHIAFAALDVMDQEPLPEDHPFWTMNHVIITPHDSGTSSLTRERLWSLLKLNVNKFINHQPIHHRVD
jgi:phosphoglycerate dehydrogenase-like enzyme